LSKIIVITGAAHGIGKGIALAFVKKGAEVVIADINKKLGQQVAREISALGGRATFFSKPVFTALLRLRRDGGGRRPGHEAAPLGRDAREVLAVLEMDSPLSTKQLKAATGLQGKFRETTYARAMRELWDRFLIVSYGEVEDGAFPSSAIGATKSIFEDLWEAASELSEDEARETLRRVPGETSVWLERERGLFFAKSEVER
jgi:NAD(P)-dependent dehydrogenase (short-subunit alcohol dehydrogenase family)